MNIDDNTTYEPSDTDRALSTIIEEAWQQERSGRDIMVRKYKKLDLFWTGSQYVVWDASVGDFRTIDQLESTMDDLDVDPAMYNRPVNIYRAWGESIVAALTADVPRTRFAPGSITNAEDILTARAYGDISELIDYHNNADTLLKKIGAILYNHGMVALYNYVHEDKSYGTVKHPTYDKKNLQETQQQCPGCGYVHSSDIQEVNDQEEVGEDSNEEASETPQEENDEEKQEADHPDPSTPATNPDDESSQTTEENLASNPQQEMQCPECGLSASPELNTLDPYSEVYESGQAESPKRRVLLEAYGPLNIIVPQNASTQKDIGYLICDIEINYALAKSLHPNIRKKIQPSSQNDASYDRWARASTEYGGNYADYVVTYRRAWLRPWAYEMLDDDDMIDQLKTLYPSGVRVTMVNDIFAECQEEDIDDCWTVSYDPMSKRIYDRSVGMDAMPIQEMFSEMVNLILLCIQYGIPETYADPEYFSFEKYKKSGSTAGLVYPAKMPTGGNLDSVFHTTRPTTVPKDAVDFVNMLQQFGQFVTGAFPSIYGGMQSSGSKTAHEYEQSRNSALQRLSIMWKMMLQLWIASKAKSCKMFKDAMLDDESFVRSTGGTDMEVWIKRSEMTGKIGEARPENDDEFPVSWSQQRDNLMQLLNSKIQPIIDVITMPENVSYLTDLLGLKNLTVPGDDDRTKQLQEIAQLMISSPIPGPGGQMMTSIPIEQDIDDNNIHATVGKTFLKSEAGQYLKDTNPDGYQNVLLHTQMHEQAIQEAAQQQQMQQMQQQEQQIAMQAQLKNKGGSAPPKVNLPQGVNGNANAAS